MTRGEGRDLQHFKPDLTVHSDAADVGYGGNLGYDKRAGMPGSWAGQSFWTAADRQESITLLELRSVRLLLARSFARYVSRPVVRHLLLHEDNSAVVFILKFMVSASKPMMAELRRLQKMLVALGISIEARWIPSAVNRFADSISRTWDPGDLWVSRRIVKSIQEQHGLSKVLFARLPLNETYPSRMKHFSSQLQEYWGDGRARFWNAPFAFLPVVIRKIEAEGGQCIILAPFWPAQPWFTRFRAISSHMQLLRP